MFFGLHIVLLLLLKRDCYFKNFLSKDFLIIFYDTYLIKNNDIYWIHILINKAAIINHKRII